MKKVITFLLLLWVIMPAQLSAQFTKDSSYISVLRYSNFATVKISNSYKKQNNHTFIISISSDGKYFVTLSKKTYSDTYIYTFYESKTGKILKTEKLKSNQDFILIGDKMLTLNNYKGLSMTDITTNTPKWNHKLFNGKPFYLHGDILLSIDKENENQIQGLNLSNCSMWTVSIPHSSGIRTIQKIDEDNLLIVADKLVKLDTKTGKMKSLKIKNYIPNGKKITGNILLGVLAVAANVASAYTTGYIFIPIFKENHEGFLSTVYPESTTIARLSSNLLQADSLFYFADRNNVFCFDTDLNVQWSTPLPPKSGSSSFLHLQNDTLWMVNCGLATINSTRTGQFGSPFYAAFNAHSGSQLMLQVMGKKQDDLHSVVNNTNHVSYLFKDTCKTFYFDTQETIINAGENRFKDFRLIEEAYCLNAETHKFVPLDSCLVYAHNMKNGDIYQVSGTDSLTHLYAPGCVYFDNGQFADSLRVIYNRQANEKFDCWIIDAQGNPALHIEEAIESMTVTNDYLFFIHDKDYFSILHKDVLKPEPAPQPKLEEQPEPKESQLLNELPNS